MSSLRGRFVSLEGGEGVGKSTQARALGRALRARGIDLVETREPDGPIRDLLLQGEPGRWTAPAEALLFAAARADHVARLIRPALERGAWVLCDRFLDSSLAYQGGAGGVDESDLRTLHRIGSGSLLPDRTLLLVLPAEEAARRAAARDGAAPDRFGQKDAEYHARVAGSFKRLAEAEPARFRTIDAAGEADDVTRRLLVAIEDLL